MPGWQYRENKCVYLYYVGMLLAPHPLTVTSHHQDYYIFWERIPRNLQLLLFPVRGCIPTNDFTYTMRMFSTRYVFFSLMLHLQTNTLQIHPWFSWKPVLESPKIWANTIKNHRIESCPSYLLQEQRKTLLNTNILTSYACLLHLSPIRNTGIPLTHLLRIVRYLIQKLLVI